MEMKQQKCKRENYVEGLDALRGIAILGVVFYHLIPGKVPGGFLGVNLFFVLSGYLIYRTSVWDVRKGEYSFLKFYRKRYRRILPALLVMVCVVMGILFLFFPETAKGKLGEIASIFAGYNNLWQMHQNASYFTRISQQSPFTHLWAIAIEIQFYLLWPFLFGLIRKLRKKTSRNFVNWLLLGTVLTGGMWMSILYQPDLDVSRLYYGTDTRIYALILGVLIAMVQKKAVNFCEEKIPLWVRNIVFIMFGSILVTSYFWVEGQMAYVYLGGLFVSSLICAIIILLLPCTSFEHILEKSPFSGIGKISYEIYLWMYPVIFLFAYQKHNYGMMSWTVQLILVFLIAVIQYLVTHHFYRQGRKKRNVPVYLVCSLLTAFVVFGGTAMISRQFLGETVDQMQETVAAKQRINTEKNVALQHRVDTEKISQQGAGELATNDIAERENESGKSDKKTTEHISQENQTKSVTAIGDSVLLGAEVEVEEQILNCDVYAKESRQVAKARAVVEDLKEKDELGDIVILALGTNGTFSSTVGEKLIDAIGPERDIYWVTVYGQHLPWQEDSNHMIRSVEKKYTNVRVVDWASVAKEHPEWFLNDGVHLTESGRTAYAQLLSSSL